jgi:hypothetical protein
MLFDADRHNIIADALTINGPHHHWSLLDWRGSPRISF